jgi:hypothetical protein
VIPEAERDLELPEKLRAEWPAILRWMIEGCLAYQREGLNPPASTLAATKAYLDAEDVLGQWLGERCIVHPRAGWTSLKSLYDGWCTWIGERGHHVGTSQGLGKRLDERGLERKRTKKGEGFLGLSLAESVSGDEGVENPANTRNGPPEPPPPYSSTYYAHYGESRHLRHPGRSDPLGGVPPSPDGQARRSCAHCHGEILASSSHTATSSGDYLHNACIDAWAGATL